MISGFVITPGAAVLPNLYWPLLPGQAVEGNGGVVKLSQIPAALTCETSIDVIFTLPLQPPAAIATPLEMRTKIPISTTVTEANTELVERINRRILRMSPSLCPIVFR